METNTSVSLCEQHFLSYHDSHPFCQTIHSGLCHHVSRSYYRVTTSFHSHSSTTPFLTPTSSFLPPDGLVLLPQRQPARSLECLQFSAPHPQRHASLVLPSLLPSTLENKKTLLSRFIYPSTSSLSSIPPHLFSDITPVILASFFYILNLSPSDNNFFSSNI